MSGSTWLAFLAAAAVGAVARHLLGGFVQDRADGRFPWGTFVVNVTGCFALGALTGLGLYHGVGDDVRLAIGTGGLGAYTTFSAFTFETVRLAEEGALDTAVRTVLAGILVGLAAAAVGLAIAYAL